MKTLITFLFTLCFFSSSFSQLYHRAKIHANNEQIIQLANAGICVDHGTIKKGHFIICDYSEQEIDKAKSLGCTVDIIIEDISSYYKNQNNSVNRNTNRSSCNSSFDYTVPTNFSYGSMAGFFTYQEALEHLDSMAAKYPNLITSRQPIGAFKTHENRNIFWLKISDNPNVDENEPEVFYSSIHHAREVASLSQLIFYMWYVLENYGTDQTITDLVNNSELYFVPVVNPDGYQYNVTTNPSGGGMWRKNRSNNGGSYGTDLNRNYGYLWGGLGASTNPTNDTYRGTAAFSEPETQAIKWFCEQHDFKMALNAHTYSNLLLYPFGYANNTPTPENSLFQKYSEVMVKESNYANIISSDLYPASGTSDDWFYGEQTTKGKIYAMTPEIGSSFWPAQTDIIPLAKENIHMNLMNAKLALRYADVTSETDYFITSSFFYHTYDIQRLGLDGNGDFTLSIIPLSTSIANIGAANTHNGMSVLQTIKDSISIVLSGSVQPGDDISYVISVNNGLYTQTDTINKIYGLGNLIYQDTGVIANWTKTGTWNSTTSDFKSAPRSITDSPNGNYPNQTTTWIKTTNPISVPNGSMAFLNYWAKWDIEAGWDYVQVQLSTNGTTWTPLCGKYTVEGNGNQATGEPLYDGTKGWVQESIDISPYLNSNVLIRFIIISDQYTTGDGFSFDDLEIRVIPNSTSSIEETNTNNVSIYPNPTNDVLNIKSNGFASIEVIEILSAEGKLIQTISNPSTLTQLDVSTFKNGMYVLNTIYANGNTSTSRFNVMK